MPLFRRCRDRPRGMTADAAPFSSTGVAVDANDEDRAWTRRDASASLALVASRSVLSFWRAAPSRIRCKAAWKRGESVAEDVNGEVLVLLMLREDGGDGDTSKSGRAKSSRRRLEMSNATNGFLRHGASGMKSYGFKQLRSWPQMGGGVSH